MRYTTRNDVIIKNIPEFPEVSFHLEDIVDDVQLLEVKKNGQCSNKQK